MSPWKPRTTATGGLPNISFIKRKPKPLGTEFRNSCTESGVLSFLEVQEGKSGMALKPRPGKLKGNAASAARMIAGTYGKEW